MSVKEIDPRGALGRLTRSAFHKARSVPSQSDMDDSARLSKALDELDASRDQIATLEARVSVARAKIQSIIGSALVADEDLLEVAALLTTHNVPEREKSPLSGVKLPERETPATPALTRRYCGRVGAVGIQAYGTKCGECGASWESHEVRLTYPDGTPKTHDGSERTESEDEK